MHVSFVSLLLCFRAANPKLEKLLNKDYVERVEIFMKETIGVEGTVLWTSLVLVSTTSAEAITTEEFQ